MSIWLSGFCGEVRATAAFDTAANYPAAWTNGSNGGTGFGAWRFFAATQDWASAFSLGSSSNAGGWNIDSPPAKSFALSISTVSNNFRLVSLSRPFLLQTNEAVFCKAVLNNDGAAALRQIAITSGNGTSFTNTDIVCSLMLSENVAGVSNGFQILSRTASGVATSMVGSLAQRGPNVFFWCMRTGPTNYFYDIAIGTNDFAAAFSSAVAPSNLWVRNGTTNSQDPRRRLHFNYTGIDRYDPGFRIIDVRAGSNSQIAVTYPSDTSHYYVLLRGSTVTGLNSEVALRVPATSPDIFTNGLLPTQSFFAVSQRYRNLPGDLDGDGMDDVYEYLNGFDAFNPADASQLAADGSGLTNYQEYRMLMGYDISPNDAISREFSVLNFGSSTAGGGAISREISVINFGPAAPVIAISREISSFNFGASASAYEAVSRELSTFNFGGSASAYEAVSREVSAFNHGGAGAAIEALGREISVFNHGGAGAAMEAISREVSVFNHEGPGAAFEAISREVSALNQGGPSATFEAISREVSVFNHEAAGASYEAISREVSVFNGL